MDGFSPAPFPIEVAIGTGHRRPGIGGGPIPGPLLGRGDTCDGRPQQENGARSHERSAKASIHYPSPLSRDWRIVGILGNLCRGPPHRPKGSRAPRPLPPPPLVTAPPPASRLTTSTPQSRTRISSASPPAVPVKASGSGRSAWRRRPIGLRFR